MTTFPQRGLVDDNFGAFSGEAFGANGWRLSPIIGYNNISEGEYMTADGYLFAMGCGGSHDNHDVTRQVEVTKVLEV